jgi:hypothetical protein
MLALRTLVLAVLLLGMAGTAVELVLLNHNESLDQMIPLGLLGLALLPLVWLAVRPGKLAVRAFQATMVLFIVAGLTGVVLHYRGNMEFQREVDPSIGGGDLFWKVMRAKAPPALAPGMMVQLGLLGLTYAFRHPALSGAFREIQKNGD